MAEYLIKHSQIDEEYYLKDVKRERSNEPMFKARGRKWKNVESRDEINPRGASTATWTKDETLARYFQSRKEAERMIKEYPVLRFAKVIEV